ncbi:MAG: FKBP-type peptidyl-prolyl cis-trans isomerase [Muribaculaceae bacterium]|nr:FKBP-type peptidyl-prolyl cis-trans isomerase [Muribaculaceae bacterium]
MKKLLYTCMLVGALAMMTSCLGSTNVEDEYKEWREANDRWYTEQALLTDPATGMKYYKQVTAVWDPAATVLIHWFNDTTLNRGNLRPLYSSTVDVKYRGMTKDATPFDSSYLRTTPADSVLRCQLNNGVIEGWALALTHMRVGDSCRVVIPYALGYGAYKRSNVVLPYTALVFDMKLVDIYGYETK